MKNVGAIAQLVERFDGIEEVVGSIPSGSTSFLKVVHGVESILKRNPSPPAHTNRRWPSGLCSG